MPIHPARLIFWHFFHRIEAELSYERWIDKYRLFLETLESGLIPYEEDWRSFRAFCKMLYLQDHRDEAKFDELLTEALEKEAQVLITLLEHFTDNTPSAPNSGKSPVGEQEEEGERPNLPFAPRGADSREDPAPAPPPAGQSDYPAQRYFHPKIGPVATEGADIDTTRDIDTFLHTDDYFPVSKREMVKAWQYLRREEKRGYNEQIDLPATVQRIGKEGLFTAPSYQAQVRNREDTLLLFIDSRGSMTPFAGLCRQLIESARNEGGHRRAPVYYFQNYPLGKLYCRPNLSDPISLKEVLAHTNRQNSIAFIISDAGAARGNADPAMIRGRVDQTKRHLLQPLKERTAHTIWINPMPEHRWKNTAAEKLALEVTAMLPLLEEGPFNFPDEMRRMLKFKRTR